MFKWLPIVLLVFSNLFMTYAWYGHLKDFRDKPLFLVIMFSWGIALMEYCLQVPANRLGISFLSLPQLKVVQEIIAMAVFAVFAVVYMKQSLKMDFLYAGMCLVGAAYFMFRNVR
ncbi:MAG: DMT family protein [Armatimonadota bacterium]